MSDVDVLMCDTVGCDRRGHNCWLSVDDTEPHEWLCSDHAIEAGYCGACGLFCAGIEVFDFGAGICDTCLECADGDDNEGDDYERWCLDEDEKDTDV